jgi:hypothetical protein
VQRQQKLQLRYSSMAMVLMSANLQSSIGHTVDRADESDLAGVDKGFRREPFPQEG